MNKNNNSIINSPAPPSIQQTGQNNVNVTRICKQKNSSNIRKEKNSRRTTCSF